MKFDFTKILQTTFSNGNSNSSREEAFDNVHPVSIGGKIAVVGNVIRPLVDLPTECPKSMGYGIANEFFNHVEDPLEPEEGKKTAADI